MPISFRWIVALLLGLSMGTARADIFWPYEGDPSGAPIISLNMNPQQSLNSAFRVAARENRLEDVKRFYQQGAEVDAGAESGVNALMYAARGCAMPVVQFLLQSRADVNHVDRDGRTALIYAVQESCLDAVKLLLAQPGIQWWHRDSSAMRAIDYARDMALAEVDGPANDILRLLHEQGHMRARQQGMRARTASNESRGESRGGRRTP